MNYSRFFYPIILFFFVISLNACFSNVTRQKSAFDGADVIKMEQRAVMPGGNLCISLYSDASIPKNKSLATLHIYGDYKSGKKTAINIKIGNKKYSFKPIDEDKAANIHQDYDPLADKIWTSTAHQLRLVFYIPDEIINTIATCGYSKSVYFMVNLANNIKIEEELNRIEGIPSDFRDFHNYKYSHK